MKVTPKPSVNASNGASGASVHAPEAALRTHGPAAEALMDKTQSLPGQSASTAAAEQASVSAVVAGDAPEASPDASRLASATTADQPEEGGTPMFCTSCGTRNSPDANFCKQCGHRMERTGPLRISEEAFARAAGRDEQVRELLVLAYRRYEDGDLPGAVEMCGQALEAAPDSTDAHSLMSTLYEKQGERDKAIGERERVLELNPGSIADREKLEELREGTLRVTPRKIISARRRGGQGLFESRMGAALVAIVAALFVLSAGALVITLGRAKRGDAGQRAAGSGQLAAGPAYGAPFAGPNAYAYNPANPANGANGAAGWPNAAGAFPGYSGQQSVAQSPIGPSAHDSAASQERADTGRYRGAPRAGEYPDGPPQSRQVAPLRVVPDGALPMERGPRYASGQPDQNGTVHLPDNGLAPSELGPPPAGTGVGSAAPNPSGIAGQNPAAGAAGNGQAPRHNQGRIEIIVAPDPGKGATASATHGASGGDAATPTMDARSQRRAALQLQLRGQYRQAATAYIKALDGAGDDAAEIHQQIGLCYQRMDDRDGAVAQYNAAIEGFKALIAAGKNVDAAKRGIRTCEAGIKACQ